MPFSIVLQGYPIHDIPVDDAQGSALQGMFLRLLESVDPAVSARLHDDKTYRPYTLSPLGVGRFPTLSNSFRGGFADRDVGAPFSNRDVGGPYRTVPARTRCYVRVGLLDDALFPTFGRYFLDRPEAAFVLGTTKFLVTGIFQDADDVHAQGIPWSRYASYAELVNQASRSSRSLTLQFLTPTSFRRGRLDFPLPHPPLVFGSYLRRFREFHAFAFPPDFAEQVDFHTGISNLTHIRTQLIRRKKINLIGFTGRVTFQIDSNAPPDFVHRMNLLADYAFFCGTGQKTTIGLGQTVRMP